ncbi:hypothetical protein ACHAQJ_006504 [Trichoderma viride]
MDRSNGLVSRPGSIAYVPWLPETSAITSHLRDCSAEAAMERQLEFGRHHPHSNGYFIQITNQGGRDAFGQQQVAYPVPQQQQQQQQQVNVMAAGTASAASRGLASYNWRTPSQDGNIFTRPPPSTQPSTSLVLAGMGQGDIRGAAAGAGHMPVPVPAPAPVPGGVSDGYAYYLNRGNGELTRLIPADMLPSLNEIPPRESERRGMIVLPPLRGVPPNGMADMNYSVTVKASQTHGPRRPSDLVQNHIDRIVATIPSTPKRNKVYCDMWIHEGRCAFTQTGCKFKHEMPLDEESQKALGLFQGLPAWFKKQQEESNMRTARESSSSEASPTNSSSSSKDFAWQNCMMGRIPGTVDSLMAMTQDKSKLDTFHSSQKAEGRMTQFTLGPIAPPTKLASDNGPWGKGFGSKIY